MRVCCAGERVRERAAAMPRAIEYSDCAKDSPQFRASIEEHERSLDALEVCVCVCVCACVRVRVCVCGGCRCACVRASVMWRALNA